MLPEDAPDLEAASELRIILLSNAVDSFWILDMYLLPHRLFLKVLSHSTDIAQSDVT